MPYFMEEIKKLPIRLLSGFIDEFPISAFPARALIALISLGGLRISGFQIRGGGSATKKTSKFDLFSSII